MKVGSWLKYIHVILLLFGYKTSAVTWQRYRAKVVVLVGS